LDLLMAEDEGPKQNLSQKLCCFGQEGARLSRAEDGATSEALWLSPVPETAGLCIPHPHPCSLLSAESRSQGGSHWSLRQKPLWPGGPLCSHQEGGRLSGAGNGAASEALWFSLVPEAAGLCVPHSHPQTTGRGVSEPRWPPWNVRQKPPVLCGHLCSDQEGGRLSVAENGAASFTIASVVLKL
jgi:hypothetical protein